MSDLRVMAEQKDAAAVIKQVLAGSGYEKWLEKDDPGTSAERQENVHELLNAAHSFVDESDEGRLADFVMQSE